jgi:hypothetical protein
VQPSSAHSNSTSSSNTHNPNPRTINQTITANSLSTNSAHTQQQYQTHAHAHHQQLPQAQSHSSVVAGKRQGSANSNMLSFVNYSNSNTISNTTNTTNTANTTTNANSASHPNNSGGGAGACKNKHGGNGSGSGLKSGPEVGQGSASGGESNERAGSSVGEKDLIVIHVYDDHKKLSKDFKCSKEVLISEMKYFEKYISDLKSFDDIDISVHCDITIFGWLMKYLEKRRILKSSYKKFMIANMNNDELISLVQNDRDRCTQEIQAYMTKEEKNKFEKPKLSIFTFVC